jgi:16S rRNA (uracil1498-N3)-methyltransferase
MLRLFVPQKQVSGARVRIVGAELRHLRVWRLAAGAHLLVFDEQGLEHEVRLERLGPRQGEAVILQSHRPARESAFDLVLAPALTRGARMDLVIEKATELGVRRIAPVVCRHGVTRGERTERWRRIALAATKQCGRTTVPPIDPVRPLGELVRLAWPGLRLIAWEDEQQQALTALPDVAAAAVVVVGPEGGIGDDELADARAHGFVPFTLAPRILRAETAAIVAVALCQHRWGDLSTAGHLR